MDDVQGVQHLLDHVYLTAELLRRGGARALVVRIAISSESVTRYVEGDGQMGGALIAQHVDQHRGEAVNRIGRLAGARREVLHRQSEERPVGH